MTLPEWAGLLASALRGVIIHQFAG